MAVADLSSAFFHIHFNKNITVLWIECGKLLWHQDEGKKNDAHKQCNFSKQVPKVKAAVNNKTNYIELFMSN